MSSQKLIHEFKQGDIVHFAGARFETVEDAHESFSHAPQDPKTLHRTGPSAVAYCRAVCIDPDADYIEHHPKRQQMEDALLWTLYHHQGGSSHIGQPIRKLLGIGQHDRLTDEQIAEAKAFGGAA